MTGSALRNRDGRTVARRQDWRGASFRVRLPLDGLPRAPVNLHGHIRQPFGIGEARATGLRLLVIAHLPSERVLGYASDFSDARDFIQALLALTDDMPHFDWSDEFPEAEGDITDHARELRIRHGIFTTIGTELAA